MNWLRSFRSWRMRYRSKPPHERVVYRLIHRHRCRRLVELGLGTAERAARMISVANHRHGYEGVQYTGIDLFEGRDQEADAPLPLKEVHQRLAGTPATVKLVPGDPLSALARVANAHAATDLLVVGSPFCRVDLDQAWFYVPRMLHSGSIVLIERPGEGEEEPAFERLEVGQIEQRAESARNRRKRAA